MYQITFEARPIQQIKITYQEKLESEEQLIFQQSYDKEILSYWKWHQYLIRYVNYFILELGSKISVKLTVCIFIYIY